MKATNRPSAPSDTMLRVELFTVEPVRPTCSMYLRQLCMFEARNAGARYIQRKYFQAPHQVTAASRQTQTPAASANSAQIRRRSFLLRIGEPARRKVRTNKKGVKNKPRLSSRMAARTLAQRGIPGMTNGQSSTSRSSGQVGVMQLVSRPVEAEAHQAEDSDDHAVDFVQAPVLSKQPVRRLVEADQNPVHQMTGG